MTRLVAMLDRLFKDESVESKKTVDNIKSDVAKVNDAAVGDVASVSRIANHLPDFFSQKVSQHWSERAEKLLKNVKLESSRPDMSVDQILDELKDDYLGAYELLKVTAKSEEEVRFIYIDMLRDSCRQILLINGKFDPQLIAWLDLDKVLVKWKNNSDELKFKVVGSLCNNLFVTNFLQKMRLVSNETGDAKSDNILAIKKILLDKMINDIARDNDFVNNEISKIIDERALLDDYVYSYLSSGVFNADLGKKILANIDKAESKFHSIQEIYGLFSRLTKYDEERLMSYVNVHYPEMTRQIAALVLPMAISGEKPFFRVINLLMLTNRQDLVRQALDPNKTGNVSRLEIDDEVIHHAYKEYCDKYKLDNQQTMSPAYFSK